MYANANKSIGQNIKFFHEMEINVYVHFNEVHINCANYAFQLILTDSAQAVTSKWHFRTTSPINTASSAAETDFQRKMGRFFIDPDDSKG